LVFWSREV